MKKKKKRMVEETGVSIRDSAMISNGNRGTLGNYIVGLLLFMMIIVGMSECLVQGFSMECEQTWLLGGILASCLMFYIGFSGIRGGEIIIALYLTGYGVVSYLMRNHIANGLAVFVNTILKKAGKYYSITFVSYEEHADLNRQKSLTIFLLFVLVFLIGVLAYLTAHKILKYLVIAITFVIAFAPEVVGLVPGEKAFALYIISVLVYLGSRIRCKNRRNIQGIEAKVQWKIQLMQIVVGIGCVLLFFHVFPEDAYDKISRETDLKTFMQNFIQTCYNNTIRRGLDKGTVDGGISFGDITGVEQIQYSDTVRLRVKYKSLDLKERAQGGLYLRGYIGSEYKEGQWQPLSQEQEAECRKLEESSGISLDDYDTATAFYRMGLERFLCYKPQTSINMFHKGTTEDFLSNYESTDGENDFWYKKYEPETFRDGMKSIHSHTFAELVVENVSETVSTQFIPYYVASDVKEKAGRLDSEETTDVGEYQWSIFNGQAEAFGVVTNPYADFSEEYEETNLIDYYDRMKILWKEFWFIRGQVEDALGQNLLDYVEGTYKGKTIKEVCPDLLKKLKLTVSGDIPVEIEGINTDGEYDVNKLLQMVARDCFYFVDDLSEYEYDEKRIASSSSFYDEGEENDLWKEIYNYDTEVVVRYLYEEADADDFFALLKHMYQFYLEQQQYETFVENTYKNVPENIKSKLEDVVEEADMAEETDLREMILFVQRYLYENTEYSLAPGETPEGEDFIEYFLFQNKRGYCVHYATAATMLFRSMGIPARYVEGYHADKDTLQNRDVYTMDGASLWHTVDLTDRYAHAWVEIYISGYGWIPVEVTKAYLDIKEEGRPDKVEEKSPEKEDDETSTKKPSSTTEPAQQTASPQEGGKNETVGNTNGYEVPRVLFGIIAILLVTALRFAIITKRHQKQGNLKDGNRAVYFYYTRMEQLLRMGKQCGKNQSLRQLLQEQAILVDGVDAKEWMHFYETINDYSFSKNGVTAEQAADARQLYKIVRTSFYGQKKIWMWWYYKYIRCL